MGTPVNRLSVPEIACYQRREIEGGTIIQYVMRKPGESVWTPVKIFRLAGNPQQTPQNQG